MHRSCRPGRICTQRHWPPPGCLGRYPAEVAAIDINNRNFVLCFTTAYLAWSIWCVLMILVGKPFDLPLARAFARFAALLGPATYWLYTTNDTGTSDRFGFRKNVPRGLVVGIVFSLLLALAHLQYEFAIPRTTHAWLNVITLSPFAEEVLFRRVAIDFLRKRFGSFIALLSSSVLFSLIHLPWWILAPEYSLAEIISGLLTMLVYGVVFGILYMATKSLWASLIPHCVNNLIAESING